MDIKYIHILRPPICKSIIYRQRLDLSAKYRPCIQAWASLGRSPGQIAMTADYSLGKEAPQAGKKICQAFGLCRGAGVGRTALSVESALIADADGAAVVWTAVSTHFQQTAMLGQAAVAADVEVIAHGAETAGTMVVQKLFGSVILCTAGGRTVKDEVADTVWSAHQLAVLHTGEEGLFARHLLATNSQGITVVGHVRKGIKGVQLVIPSAVRAAMAAWMMAFTIEAQVIFEELEVVFMLITD